MLVIKKVDCLELLFVERTVVIRGKGSVEFSPEEQGADIVLIDVKCTALAGTEYVNTKSLPSYGYYGCCTLFGGATVAKRIPLEFVYQRVVDFESVYRRLKCYLTKIEELCGEIFNYVAAPGGTPPTGSAEPRDSFEYRGLPYAKLKITNDKATQWDITVRHYKEIDVKCQSVSKSDDPTKGEPEYPSPTPVPDPDNFPSSLPTPEGAYPGADPNDFPPGSAPWVPKPIYFGVRIDASTGAGAPNCTMDNSYLWNFTWAEAGPAPYTVEYGFNGGSPCSGKFHGFRVVAADGTKSQDVAPFTVYGGAINVFSEIPFTET